MATIQPLKIFMTMKTFRTVTIKSQTISNEEILFL